MDRKTDNVTSLFSVIFHIISGTARGARRRRRSIANSECLEARQLLSSVTVRSLINGVVTTADSRMHLEVDSSIVRTYEVRNTGTEALRIKSIRDDSGNGFDTAAFQTSTFVASENRRDVVHDAKRDILYISTNDGLVQQYDLVQRRFLSSFAVGGRPGTLDISPNQDRLIVSNFGGPWVSLIDLTTGTITQEPIGSNESTISAVFLSDTAYAVSLSSWSGIFGLQTTNDPSNAVLSISADRTTVGYVEAGISSGGVGHYSLKNNRTTTAGTGWYNFEIAVSRNGQQIAVPTYGGTFIYDAGMRQIGLIGTYADEGPIGVAYSPNSDIVYFAWADSDYQHASIDAWDTKTLTRSSVIDPTWRYNWTGNGFLEDGRLKISRDGNTLFATVPGGVMVYGTEDLLPIFTGGDTDQDSLLDPTEIWTYRARDTAMRGFVQNTVVVKAATIDGRAEWASASSWIRGVNYGVDFGDAPDSGYKTLFESNGASHRIVSGFYLGNTVDQDFDAQPSASADADDKTNRDDDDGVQFLSPLAPDTSVGVVAQVTSGGRAWLNAWLDFNSDGDWDDFGEQIATELEVRNGSNSFSIDVPTWAKPGTTIARFRLSSVKALSSQGPAIDGEVEDYQISIQPNAPVLDSSPSLVGTLPTFTWSGVPYATGYEVQVNVLNGVPTVLSRTIVSSPAYTPATPLGIGKYAVWVRTLSGDSRKSAWSVMRGFRVDVAPEMTVPFESTFDQTPEITWKTVLGASRYDVFIQSEQAGTRAVYGMFRNIEGSSFTPAESLPHGLYRVWVRGVTERQHYSSWSLIPATIFVGGKTQVLSPIGESSPATSFTWKRVDGAARYELWVTQTESGRRILQESQIESTTWTPEFAIPKGHYKTWVRAISADGVSSPWSQTATFVVSTEIPFRTGVNPTFDQTPKWSWDAIFGAEAYDVLIQAMSDSGDFSTVLLQSGITDTEYTAETELPLGNYRAYYRPVINGRRGQWQSPAAEFNIGGQTSFQPLDMTYPESPGFAWRPVDGAVRYELQISRQGSMKSIINRTDLTQPNFQSDTALPKGNFTAIVRAIGPGEQPAPWSAPIKLNVAFDRPFLAGYGSTFDTTPTWSWSGIRRSDSYDLRFERKEAAGYTDIALYRGLTFLQFTATSALDPGDYRVSYRSVGINGNVGPWQAPAALLNIGGETSIKRVLVNPNRTVTLEWIPVAGARTSEIRIQNESTGEFLTQVIDAASRFTLATVLPSGRYRAWIRSISNYDLTSEWSKQTNFNI